MAGNFRGVLIFVIFVVGSAVTKIITHENECLRIRACAQGHGGRGQLHDQPAKIDQAQWRGWC